MAGPPGKGQASGPRTAGTRSLGRKAGAGALGLGRAGVFSATRDLARSCQESPHPDRANGGQRPPLPGSGREGPSCHRLGQRPAPGRASRPSRPGHLSCVGVGCDTGQQGPDLIQPRTPQAAGQPLPSHPDTGLTSRFPDRAPCVRCAGLSTAVSSVTWGRTPRPPMASCCVTGHALSEVLLQGSGPWEHRLAPFP